MGKTLEEKAIEAQREYMRKWKAKNKDKVNAYMRTWRKENPDKVKAYNQRYWEKKAAKKRVRL